MPDRGPLSVTVPGVVDGAFAELPRYFADADRVTVESLTPGFWRVRAAFGFMEPPDVPRALSLAYWAHVLTPILGITSHVDAEASRH